MRSVRRTVRRSGDGINVVADVNVVAEAGTASSTSVTSVTQQSSSARRRRDGTRGDQMAENEVRDELTDEELDQEAGEELPDREAMSLVNANLAAPVNAAVALNVLSDGSVAYANAEQNATIIQST